MEYLNASSSFQINPGHDRNSSIVLLKTIDAGHTTSTDFSSTSNYLTRE